jgi:hypothetical protein
LPPSQRVCIPTPLVVSLRGLKPEGAPSLRGATARIAVCAIAAAVWLWTSVPSAAAGRRAGPGDGTHSSLLREASLCLGCHGASAEARGTVAVDADELYASAHRTLTCVDCHTDLDTVPHPAELQAVSCSHCHGHTAVREVAGPAAESLISRHEAARERGAEGLPTCTDCHGSHDVDAATAPSASGAARMVAQCAGCHPAIAEEFEGSVHGQALLEGAADAPNCGSCHPEHPKPNGDRVRGVREAGVVATCVSCHEDPGLQEVYALPADRLSSFLGSYHGAAVQLGDTRTADCASCHGNHHILKSTDPDSSVHPQNLQQTCGECHPGVGAMVARGKVHVLPSPESDSLLYYINLGFKWFTFAIIGALVGHIALELFGRWRGRG